MKRLIISILVLSFLLALSGCGYLTPQDTAAIQPVISQDQTQSAAAEVKPALAEAEPALSEAEKESGQAEVGLTENKISVRAYNNASQKSAGLKGTQATNYVGLGYNILEKTYINPQGFTLGRHILQESEVQKRLKTANAPSQSSYTIMGQTVKTYSQDLSAKLNLKSNYPLFSGSVDSEYDMTQTKKSNVYFIKSISGYPKYSEYIDITNDFKDILDPIFEGDLNGSLSPEELFGTYGTHLVVEALMGARCTYNYTYTSTTAETTTQVKAKVDATYRFISGSGSVDDKKTATEFLSDSVFQSVLSGGKDVDASTLDSLLKNFPAWVDSLSTSTPTIYGISNINSLIPVWKLTTNAVRAKELQDYYNSRGGDIQKMIDSMSVIPPPPPPPETYIQSIVVTSDKDKATAQKVYSGYTLINADLNKGAKGDYIYLSYNTTNDPEKALKNIRITYDNFSLPGSYTKNPHDLNKGAHGKYIYLWTSTNASNGKPIKAINVFYGENADMPTGYTAVKHDDSGENADLNKGAGGAYIYLGIKR